jgi:invasion protein IalB
LLQTADFISLGSQRFPIFISCLTDEEFQFQNPGMDKIQSTQADAPRPWQLNCKLKPFKQTLCDLSNTFKVAFF